jgi:hypothetical protein
MRKPGSTAKAEAARQKTGEAELAKGSAGGAAEDVVLRAASQWKGAFFCLCNRLRAQPNLFKPFLVRF